MLYNIHYYTVTLRNSIKNNRTRACAVINKVKEFPFYLFISLKKVLKKSLKTLCKVFVKSL